MNIVIGAKKAFGKIQYPFIIKTLSKLKIQENFLNLRNIYKKNATVNIILSGFSTKIRQGCPVSPLLFNIVLEVLTNAIRKENEINIIQIENKEIKCF